MRAFAYDRPTQVEQAVAAVTADPQAAFLAGGTTQLDLMKDGVWTPDRLVDITRLPLRGVMAEGQLLRVGALTTMEQLAAEPVVAQRLLFVREALLAGASTQLRNMATIGGNLLQRTRCRYFRDPSVSACNRRSPDSGCAAVANTARMHAVLGVDERCVALHASDVAVPLVALDASVTVTGAKGQRDIPLTAFWVRADEGPSIENVLGHGELITEVRIPLLPERWVSGYLKVRDRASYEFALTSAAVAVRMDSGVIGDCRIALGGVGSVPWRAREAEELLRGTRPDPALFDRAGRAVMAGAYTLPGTAFKVELAVRTLTRQLTVLMTEATR
ncbi:carbon-monoxide dehydrogenase medium subunit [Catellatospora sp. TT07R-123]|uniref:FAD binding domain-containing protein n=1 Tax=Catellatospora sp. TT07R-123 TaxID=2733863 RepID=UPI001B1092E8|nr:xanthine dehydrogenase family protein subunit M [Catellatospora sp. TT07R-123]GHJ43673.1 carbon-monoxide dehydrogenase medium subunit [Catellatospora sp. TT07R-123]